MPTIRLTQRAVETLKPPAVGRVEYWDSHLPGFGLRVAGSGRKTWVAMYRVDGKQIRETVGTFALIPNVAEARDRARQSMTQARAGKNPVAERRERALAARVQADALPSTFHAIAERYLERYAKKNTKPTTWMELRRQLEVDVFPKWSSRPVASITRHDVTALLDGIADRGSPVQANRTLARLKTLFKWVLDEELILADPTARVRKVVKETARDRVLTDDEIRLFWAGCEMLGWPFGPMYQLLLLTAQRRDEVGGMEWAEVDLDRRLWTIPREKAKNNRAHEVHFSALAIEILEGLPRLGETRFVLTTNGERPISGFSKSKDRLDGHMLDQVRAQLATVGKDPGGAQIDEWILHDLRRTAATGMARLNIPPHVVDKILNHVSGSIRGVAAVYNRHSYLDERKSALEAWARHVENIVRPSPSNVVFTGHGALTLQFRPARLG
jgi:integrase